MQIDLGSYRICLTISISHAEHLGGTMRKPGNRPDHVELPAEPLLNEEQRAALDAALAKKRLEQGGFIL